MGHIKGGDFAGEVEGGGGGGGVDSNERCMCKCNFVELASRVLNLPVAEGNSNNILGVTFDYKSKCN